MDFDLFNMEDDELLLSAYIAPSEKVPSPTNFYPEFINCGENSTINSNFSSDSFVSNFVIFTKNHEYDHQNDIELMNKQFHLTDLNSSMIGDHVFNQAKMSIQKLVVSLKNQIDMDDISYYQARHQITTLLQSLIYSKKSLPTWKYEHHLQKLRNLLNQIGNQELFKTIFLANSSKGNESDLPAYHLLHGYFEWRFLDLVILQKHASIENNKTIFQNQLNRMFEDLIQISICLFEKKNLPSLLYVSPFPCVCIKECWLMVQYLIEHFEDNDGKYFWTIFNETIRNLQNHSDSFKSQNISEFIIWLSKGLIQLQGYNSNGHYIGPRSTRVTDNFTLLENVVEEFFNANPTEEQIRVMMWNLMPIIVEWWPQKIDIPMIMWEYFNKKLNCSFFIAGSTPDTLAVSCSSGKGYLDKVQSLLENDTNTIDTKLSSFLLFLVILGKTILRFVRNSQNNQMQKILSRIFSKFSLSKLLLLNEVGIHHLIKLFLTLALSGPFNEIGSKLSDKLLSIIFAKITPNRQVYLTKGHVALLMLYTQNSMEISDYITKVLGQIKDVKADVNVLKVLSEGMRDIFECSSFDKGEYLLIDTWTSDFLNSSSSVEQDRLLEAIHMIFEKIKITTGEIENVRNLLKSLNTNILPFVKQNLATSFSNWLPLIAADFCIHGTGNDTTQFQKNFKFFVEMNCSNKQAILQFLLTILESDKSSLVDSSVIMQNWLKSLVIIGPNNEDVGKLTRIVSNLVDFKTVSCLGEAECESVKDPLCVFIASVGKNYNSCQDFQQKCLISDKFNSYLMNFEKWVNEKNEKNDISFRFYSFMAIVIYNCGNIVYAKSKISCFFHVSMTRFIIPQSLQMGKPPDPKFAQIMHKIWPVLVQGIGKMNFQTDPYITKSLIDLIVKWVPHFRISSNSKIGARPFINCLSSDTEHLSLFVFTKLTSVFLTIQRRQASPNACLIIKIFQEVVDTISDDEPKMLIYLKATNFATLEHLMMVEDIVPSHGMLHELLKKIIQSSAFQKSLQLQNIMIEHLKNLASKHLSYFTLLYFDLLTLIVNISVKLIDSIMVFLSEQIKILENKRGVSEDNRLRTCMEKLKGAMIAKRKT